MSDMKERIRMAKERKKEHDSGEIIVFESTDVIEYPDEIIFDEKIPDEEIPDEKIPDAGEIISTENEKWKKRRSEEHEELEFESDSSGEGKRNMVIGAAIGVVLVVFIAVCAVVWFSDFKSGEQQETVKPDISTEMPTESLKPETEIAEVAETEEESSGSMVDKPVFLNETLYLGWGPSQFFEEPREHVIAFTPEGEGTDEYFIKIYDVSEGLKLDMVVTDASGNIIAGSSENDDYSFGFYANMAGGEDYNITVKASEGTGEYSLKIMKMTIPYDFTTSGQSTGFTDKYIVSEYYRFTADKTGIYGFYLDKMDDGVKHKMSVLDENGVVLMESPDGLENSMGFDLELIKGLQYYIFIEKYQGEGSYTLTAVKP